MSDARLRGRPNADDGSIPTDDEVLRVALDSFAEQGYEATSVREIARGLGVSHNLIPQRFGSKDRLWYAAVDHAFGTLLNELLPVALEDQPDEISRLRSWMVHFVEFNAARPALLRIINQESAAAGPRFDYLFDGFIQPVREAGDAFLAGLEAQGLVTTTSADLVYFFMMHGAGGASAYPALAARFGTTVDPDDPDAIHRHAEATVSLLFDGLRRSPAGPPTGSGRGTPTG